MIRNIIQLKVKPGKAIDLAGLYQRHFKALKQAGDNVRSYEVYIDRRDDTIAYSTKVFDNEADLNAHNASDELKVFLGELKEYMEGGADYHECTQLAAL